MSLHLQEEDGGTMRTVVALLFLCLCDPGHSDCQADCLSCSNILSKQFSFNPTVCLIECEGNISPSFYWNFCQTTLTSPISTVNSSIKKRSREEADALFPKEDEQMEEDLLLPMALQRFDHVTRALGINEKDLGDESNQLDAAYKSLNALSLGNEYEEQEGEDAGVVGRGQGDAGFSKRFGGFVKGRHGYRRLMSPGRSYQKRYGGFIGIRKSARKWNNQKRFSEFLKQYLGMSTRATEFNSLSEDLTEQNEV